MFVYLENRDPVVVYPSPVFILYFLLLVGTSLLVGVAFVRSFIRSFVRLFVFCCHYAGYQIEPMPLLCGVQIVASGVAAVQVGVGWCI